MVAEVQQRDPHAGLSDAEVAARVQQGLVNALPDGPSRTTADIVKANVFTRFNLILSVLVVVILLVAPIQDALFGLVMVINTAIGIIQELRAKRTLDRLALLSAPRARVIRNGQIVEVDVAAVVRDDVLEVRTGDQVVVDGIVLSEEGLEINESLLTGESDPIQKKAGDRALSGSFVVAGTGRFVAARVGLEAYAAKLATEARRFTLTRSELRVGIDWILRIVSWTLIPVGVLLIWSQMNLDEGLRQATAGTVAGLVAMVPQGLVLLTSMALAVAVIRLGRRNVLVQELPAVEGLARVDTVCLDKTGTLTEGRLHVVDIIRLDQSPDPQPALAALVALDRAPNATVAAIADSFPSPPSWKAVTTVPFSSSRKWSGAAFAGHGTWVLGAPEVVANKDLDLLRRVASLAAGGNRVLVLARTDAGLADRHLPGDLAPVALVVLGDRVRPDAGQILDYFSEQGVDIKVISGDHPQTVAAVAHGVGVAGARRVVDGRQLPTDPKKLEAVMADYSIFGRVQPQQKREMIRALQRRGRVVAMTGDGVNDVLALKDADIGVAMGSGSGASRAVAQVVLLDSEFAALPEVVGEGRRVIANIERVANLFVTKTIYAVALAVAISIAALPFPFLPRHLTLVGSLTIGIPGFFLALEPSARRARTGFMTRVLRFAIPVGVIAALATFAAYGVAQIESVPLDQARTIATLVLTAVGLFALVMVCRPLTASRKWLIWSMAGLFVVVLLWSFAREFYALDLPRAAVVLAAIGISALTGGVMYLGLRTSRWVQLAPGWIQQAPELLDQAPESIREPLEAAGVRRLASWLSRQANGERPKPVARRPEPSPSAKTDIATQLHEAIEIDLRTGDTEEQLRLPLD